MNDYINEHLILLSTYIVIFLVLLSFILDKILDEKKQKDNNSGSILKDVLGFIGIVWLIDILFSENEIDENNDDSGFDDE